MRNILKSIISPILSILLLIVAQGFFLSFISVILKNSGQTEAVIGYIHSAFYAGLILGAWKAESIIFRIGHIRTFSLMASVITGTILFQQLNFDPGLWILIRFVAGICYGNIFVVIESWLLDKSTLKTRGRVLSLYMIAFYGAQSFGQFLLDTMDLSSVKPYIISAMLTSFALIPVCYTRAESPSIKEPVYQNMKDVFLKAPFGFMGCILTGMMLSSLYSFTPNYAQVYGMRVSLLVFVTIFGGMCLQWPIGKLSDIYDRRSVLLLLSFITALTALSITFLPTHHLLIYALAFIIGGLGFTLYPLSITQVCDRYDASAFTSVTGILLIAYGIGSTVGPLVTPVFMFFFDIAGLYTSLAFYAGLLTLVGVMTYSTQRKVPPHLQIEYVALPRTSPIVYDLDPRQEDQLRG